MMDLQSREALLATVRSLRDELNGIVAAVDGEQANQTGSLDAWSFKDTVAHLTSWRLATAARLEAAQRGGEPEMPWPTHLEEDDVDEGDVDEINHWFYDQNQHKPLAEVLRESNDTFDRVEHAIAALPEADLLEPDRFPWTQGRALGPGVIEGTSGHYREHEADLRAFLARA